MTRTRFPTALDTGTGFSLELKTPRGDVAGATVKEFFRNILAFIEKNGSIRSVEIPFSTSGSNYLISLSPNHPNGREFSNFDVYQSKSLGSLIYINTNHPRFFALRQGARLLEAAGLTVLD